MINKCCSEQRNALNSLKIRIVVLLAQANYVCLYCFDEDQIIFYDVFFFLALITCQMFPLKKVRLTCLKKEWPIRKLAEGLWEEMTTFI